MIFCSTYNFLLHLSICWKKLYYKIIKTNTGLRNKKGIIYFWLPISRESIFLRILFKLLLVNHFNYNANSWLNLRLGKISIFNFSVVFVMNTFILYHLFNHLSIIYNYFNNFVFPNPSICFIPLLFCKISPCLFAISFNLSSLCF